jgi:hypothetical protein
MTEDFAKYREELDMVKGNILRLDGRIDGEGKSTGELQTVIGLLSQSQIELERDINVLRQEVKSLRAEVPELKIDKTGKAGLLKGEGMEKDGGAELSTANEVTVIDARALECEEKETGLCEKEDDLDNELETAIIGRSKAEFNYARRKELWDQGVKFWYEKRREEAASGSGQGFVESVSIWSQAHKIQEMKEEEEELD